jgi:5-deoxy-glucuronate isomerase
VNRLSKAKHIEGFQDIFPEENSLLNYLAFSKVTLSMGQTYGSTTEGFETVLVILTGTASISSEGHEWTSLGGRTSVFEGKATAVYISCQSEFQITAETDIEVAVCKAKAEHKYPAFLVKPSDVAVQRRGCETWQRDVHDIITGNGEGRVHRIILGETYNHAGHWSSYPPHKHDGEHFPEEPNLEEIYYYQVNPEQGFGVQLHYTKDGSTDDAYIVRNGDSLAIDKGYHPLSAAGGYEIYYLWFMAGEAERTLRPYDDPDHKWLQVQH